MVWRFCMWTDEAIEHIAEHGVSQADFEHVIANPLVTTASRSSGLPAAIGHAPDGRRLFCVYEIIDEMYIQPVTAYEIGE
jgi:uncharacterized DUF497 family protein